jgi:hypothetical protein
MVMIPLLLVIVLSQIIQNEVKFISFLASGMLIWNLSFGLIPLRSYDLDNCNALSKKILATEKEQKKQLFVLFNKPRIENEAKYYAGKYPLNIMSGSQYDNIFSVKSRIDGALSNGISVFTDCPYRPHTLSRERLVLKNDFEDLFSGYNYQKVDSAETLSGKYYLVEISRK